MALRHGAVSIRVVGFRARGDARPDGDYDFLVVVAPGRDLFDLIRLQCGFQSLLGGSVDVVGTRAVNRRLAPFVLEAARQR